MNRSLGIYPSMAFAVEIFVAIPPVCPSSCPSSEDKKDIFAPLNGPLIQIGEFPRVCRGILKNGDL